MRELVSSTLDFIKNWTEPLRQGAAMRLRAIANMGAELLAGSGLDFSSPAPRSSYVMECYGPDGSLKWREAFSNLVTSAGKNDVLSQYFKSQFTITNFALTSNVITITAANNLIAGQWVLVQLGTNTTYNGVFQVASANSTTFTYNFTHANVSSGADTGTVGFAPHWYVGLVDGGSTPTYAAGDTMSSHSGWTENANYSNANRPTLTLGTVSAGSVDNSASKAQFNVNATATIAGAFIATDNVISGTTGLLYGEANFTGGNRSVQNGDTLNVTVTLTQS